MIRKYRTLLIGLVVIVFAAFVVGDLLQHRGPADLKGGFREIAFARNEQNKGGIVRIYAFSVEDPTDADYLGCGELLPHNDYGSLTKAFFFAAGTPTPDELTLEPPHFDTLQYHPVAVYIKGKDGTGSVVTNRLSFGRTIAQPEPNFLVRLIF